MISKKDLIPKYVKITNYNFGTYFRNGRQVNCFYNGIGRLEKIDNENSLVEISKGCFVWIDNDCLEWENNITEINVVETEVETDQTEINKSNLLTND